MAAVSGHALPAKAESKDEIVKLCRYTGILHVRCIVVCCFLMWNDSGFHVAGDPLRNSDTP